MGWQLILAFKHCWQENWQQSCLAGLQTLHSVSHSMLMYMITCGCCYGFLMCRMLTALPAGLTCNTVVGDGPGVRRCACCAQAAGKAATAAAPTRVSKGGGVGARPKYCIGRIGRAVGAFNCAQQHVRCISARRIIFTLAGDDVLVERGAACA